MANENSCFFRLRVHKLFPKRIVSSEKICYFLASRPFKNKNSASKHMQTFALGIFVSHKKFQTKRFAWEKVSEHAREKAWIFIIHPNHCVSFAQCFSISYSTTTKMWSLIFKYDELVLICHLLVKYLLGYTSGCGDKSLKLFLSHNYWWIAQQHYLFFKLNVGSCNFVKNCFQKNIWIQRNNSCKISLVPTVFVYSP